MEGKKPTAARKRAGSVLNEKLAASLDSLTISDELKKATGAADQKKNGNEEDKRESEAPSPNAVSFRLDQRRATLGGSFDAAAAGLPAPPPVSPGSGSPAKKSSPVRTKASNYASGDLETQTIIEKRSKWRKSSSWSPHALQEELKKYELREGADKASTTDTADLKKTSGGGVGSRKRMPTKGSHSPLRKGKTGTTLGTSSDTTWSRVIEHGNKDGAGSTSMTTDMAATQQQPAADGSLTSSIVQELRKMKELKKQEEEEAIKEAESGKNKKKARKKVGTMRRIRDKSRRRQEVVLPTLVDRALVYLERNSADVDQASLSDDMSGMQKKILKCLKDALDSDLKHASKTQLTASTNAGGLDPGGALSPRWTGSAAAVAAAGSRVAMGMQTSTLSALKKDENGEWIVDFNSYDLTTVTAFLKYYLTEQPLISEEIYNGLSAAIEIQFQSFRQNEIHSLLSRLPHINLRLLRRILEFLAVISKNVEHKLTIGRVATCFATVLLQPSHLDAQDIKVQRKDISLLRELIMNYDGLFTTNQQLQFIERDGNLLVRYATLSKIVEKLVDESYSETEFADIIFLTHSYFTSAPALLRALANIHKDNNRMPTMATKNWQHRIRLRVLGLIRDWVYGYPEEIMSNSEFMEKLKEFDKPAGLLGRNSLIEEEESVFLALCGWIQDAEAKLKSLSQAAEQNSNASAATPGTVKSEDDSVLKLATAPDAKVHDEELSDIEVDDEELSGSDVELNFSDEDDDEESDSDDGGDKSDTSGQHPLANKRTGLPLELSKIKQEDNNSPGISLRRTPPMLAQMKRGPQMMSSSDFFNILAKGTQIMLKDQRAPGPSTSPSNLRKQQPVLRKSPATTPTTTTTDEQETKQEAEVKDSKEDKQDTGAHAANDAQAKSDESQALNSSASNADEHTKEARQTTTTITAANEKSEEAKSEGAKSEANTEIEPRVSESEQEKSEAVEASSADESSKKDKTTKKKTKKAKKEKKERKTTEDEEENGTKKLRKTKSSKSSIAKRSTSVRKPPSLAASLSETSVGVHALEPQTKKKTKKTKKELGEVTTGGVPLTIQIASGTDSPTVTDAKPGKTRSQEKKVKKTKKAAKKKYQTLKKLSSKKSKPAVADDLITSAQQGAEAKKRQGEDMQPRLAEVLFDVAFPPTIPNGAIDSLAIKSASADNQAPIVDKLAPEISDAEVSGDKREAVATSASPRPPASSIPSPKTSGEATPSVDMDAIDRGQVLERIKDRTDIESELLRHLIGKERQLEREVESLRKTVERLVSDKVERFALHGTKDDSSGSVPTRKGTHLAPLGSGGSSVGSSSKKSSLIRPFKNDADVIVPVSKDSLGGESGFKVFALDHVTLAKELTVRDSELFRAINSRELVHKRFMKSELSPTFQKMVLSFNQIGDWVLSEVLRYDTPADRGNAITMFIKICDQLWSLKNFNMLFAVLGGLNKTPVRRLKASWKKVPSKEMKIFKKQMTLTDTEKNNSVYRHALRRAKPPLVPYLALFSKDLFSLEEGVPTTLSAEEDATISLINFDKLRLLYQLLKEFRQLQQTPYSNLDGVSGASSLQVLLDMTPPLEEKDSYTISYKWEPRQPQS